MSDESAEVAVAQAHAADTEFFVRRGMTKGYEIASAITPPLYIALAVARYGRGHLNVNRVLRATWVGGSVGILGGGAFEYARSAYSNEQKVRLRRIRATYDTASIRVDDHATIGAILMAVLTPAIFWRKAAAANLVLGGAGIGSAIGTFAHYARSISGDPPPKVEVPSLPLP